jgi:hypothetical protein
MRESLVEILSSELSTGEKPCDGFLRNRQIQTLGPISLPDFCQT